MVIMDHGKEMDHDREMVNGELPTGEGRQDSISTLNEQLDQPPRMDVGISTATKKPGCPLLDLPPELKFMIFDIVAAEHRIVEITVPEKEPYPLTALRAASPQLSQNINSWYSKNKRWLTYKDGELYATPDAYNTTYYTHMNMEDCLERESSKIEAWRAFCYPDSDHEADPVGKLVVDVDFNLEWYDEEDDELSDEVRADPARKFMVFVFDTLLRTAYDWEADRRRNTPAEAFTEPSLCLRFAESLSLGVVELRFLKAQYEFHCPEVHEDQKALTDWRVYWYRMVDED